MIWNEILCLGDSLTFGSRDEYQRSYPAELGRILTEKTGEFYYCHNYAITGETSSDLLRRSWDNVSSKTNANIMLLMIGTNDTQAGIPIDIYRDNLRQIISVAYVHGMYVIVATLPTLGFTPLYISNTSYIEKYNDTICELSKEMQFDVCDMSGLEEYYIDGVHLTHTGNVVLAKKFADSILSMQERR